ncbi:hypothetical protein EIL87_02705 [Saccharopolyspora rhizosphaerae]|uniref:Uncharacterized protein n=1 Tax=Saccharopolyspora rhizosphaerae TaxID=2492662 RepID=A0A426K3F5_9PSEU|nr:hypothetical protein [Saccharopolyspora rhizosphaerae]RRO19909.1 hypothetical protein EIL87_02705 [Saccharopolyspora rhizosphaerae]
MVEEEAVRLVERLAGEMTVEVADPGEKGSDYGDERWRRVDSLARLRVALDVEELVAEAAAQHTESAAAESVWLGASLADLSAVTGRTRQAARKRWPQLGSIHRRRKWLGDHVEDITHMAGLLVSHADELVPGWGQAGFLKQVRLLREGLDRCAADFAEDATPPDDPAGRWRALDELVTTTMRRVVETAGDPATPEAGFALHGATGVLGYYDHATSPDRE